MVTDQMVTNPGPSIVTQIALTIWSKRGLDGQINDNMFSFNTKSLHHQKDDEIPHKPHMTQNLDC